jgi:hypothetical protein
LCEFRNLICNIVRFRFSDIKKPHNRWIYTTNHSYTCFILLELIDLDRGFDIEKFILYIHQVNLIRDQQLGKRIILGNKLFFWQKGIKFWNLVDLTFILVGSIILWKNYHNIISCVIWTSKYLHCMCHWMRLSLSIFFLSFTLYTLYTFQNYTKNTSQCIW